MINNCLNLTKLFFKSLQMSKVEGARRKRLFNFLLLTVLLLIFIPFVLFFGLFMYSMTEELAEVGYASIGLEMTFFLVAIFTFVFSFSVILNQFYFSEDIPSLLPLPIKPGEIVISKFTTCFIAENLMEFILLLVGVIGYIGALKLPIGHFILSIFGIVTLPIIPMVYCGIICLMIMYFTKFIKNKETIRKISILAVLLVLVFFVSMMGSLQNFDFEKFVENFANGNHGILNISRILFPHIQYFIGMVDKASISSLIIYLIVNVVYLVVFTFIASKLYLEGVIGLYGKDTKTKNNSTKLLNNLKENDVVKSYLKKEIKTLFRSPTLFINCVLINGIWPIFAYVIYKVTMSTYTLHTVRSKIVTNPNQMMFIILLYVVGISVLLPALNSIAASSFSREGKHFSFIKYIPMKYRIQWFVKVLTSFLFAFIGVNFYTTIFYLITNVPLVWTLVLYLISFLIIYFVSALGVFIDSIQPKLVWDDEINSLRENYNTFMLMGFSLLLFFLLVGGSYILYKKIAITLETIIGLIVLVMTIMSILISKVIIKYGAKNIIEQEEL